MNNINSNECEVCTALHNTDKLAFCEKHHAICDCEKSEQEVDGDQENGYYCATCSRDVDTGEPLDTDEEEDEANGN